ncbi:aminodeoxychorismate synthase component I [Sporolactobacillus sp. THM7-7]|nr:aminodeoxychorismate synthase component I [Sporolactobacillus sp. THM7-7]
MKNDYMEFHFRHSVLQESPAAFSEPVAVIQTDRLDQVLACLRAVEKWTEKGYYAAGYVSYEAAPAFNPAFQVNPDPKWPLVFFGIYTGPQRVTLKKSGQAGKEVKWAPDTSRENYDKAIHRIHEEIAEGNTYQVNYTMRLSAKDAGDGYALFQQLKASQQADFCAYLHFGTRSILSASPECFFAWDGQRIMTRPMKGTRPRGLTVDKDTENKKDLQNAKKDQSENVMIVDLLRNDLGRIAKTGSVKVTKLFDIETYPTVFQMTSTIEAETKEGTTLTDIFKALFPCGSVTGAPKISTMALIRQLETSPREVYCGAIGYIEPGNHAVFNVPIRTVLIDENGQSAVYGAGSGITWDSTSEAEYDEVFNKAQVLRAENIRPSFDLLESLRLENGRISLMDKHVSRMKRSAGYFQYPIDGSAIRQALYHEASRMPNGLYKIRLLLDSAGDMHTETKPIKQIEDGQEVVLASEPVFSQNLFLYHKTTFREVYDSRRRSGFFDTLLWNEKGNVTEFTNGNVVCQISGRFFTPPVEDGLLAGTFRETLVGSGVAIVRSLSIQDVKEADAVWFVNSVRGWVPVELIEDKHEAGM